MVEIKCKKCKRVIAKVDYGKGEILCKNCGRMNKYEIYMSSCKIIENMIQYK
jgi:uncharacterized Zn finger protein (UPF0148 family)